MVARVELLAAYLERDRDSIPPAALELIVFDSYRAGHLSAGKGAEILRLPIESFLKAASRMGIAVLDAAPEDLSQDLDAARNASPPIE